MQSRRVQPPAALDGIAAAAPITHGPDVSRSVVERSEAAARPSYSRSHKLSPTARIFYGVMASIVVLYVASAVYLMVTT